MCLQACEGGRRGRASKGSNSLSGRELRALMRSNQATDKGKQDNEPGSTKGERTDKF